MVVKIGLWPCLKAAAVEEDLASSVSQLACRPVNKMLHLHGQQEVVSHSFTSQPLFQTF